MKKIIRNALRSLTLTTLGSLSKPAKGIHLLNSHILAKQVILDSTFFDHQLKKLSKSTIVPFEEAVDLINNKASVKHSLVAFSYDDGFKECYTHIASVLEKYNGYACFFINPNFVNGDSQYVANFLSEKVHMPEYKSPMSWFQIKDLKARGHMIGAHTMDHIRISELTDKNDIKHQIGECQKVIFEEIGCKTEYFAFPYGHPNRDFGIDDVMIAKEFYNYIFSASNWKNYFSYDGLVYNRRHCEPYWKESHINYFLSKKIAY